MRCVQLKSTTYKCCECKTVKANYVLTFDKDLIQVPLCERCVYKLYEIVK
jgi:hypothetical protein